MDRGSASTGTRECFVCHRSPACLAWTRCGHVQVCHPCTEQRTSQRIPCYCPTCGNQYVGFSWNLLNNILETMQWELEMEVYLLNPSHEDLENPYTPMHLGADPLPPMPRICTRCKLRHAIFYDRDFLWRMGPHIAFCGGCALHIMACTDPLPINPEVFTLD